MALTALASPSALRGSNFSRKKSETFNKALANNYTSNKGIYYEPAGSVATDGSGDIDIDLTGTLSTVDMAFIQLRENSAYTFAWDSAATAGHLKFRVFDDGGLAVTSTTVAFGYIVVGTEV